MSYKRAKKSIMKNSKWKNYFDKYAQLKMIKEWDKQGLYLLYLPPYSPELNLVEMLWREMKYTWMDLNALDSFDDFYKHIQNMLNFFGLKYDINFG